MIFPSRYSAPRSDRTNRGRRYARAPVPRRTSAAGRTAKSRRASRTSAPRRRTGTNICADIVSSPTRRRSRSGTGRTAPAGPSVSVIACSLLVAGLVVPFDNRDELEVGSLELVAEESVHFERVLAVDRVDGAEDIELDLVLLHQPRRLARPCRTPSCRPCCGDNASCISRGPSMLRPTRNRFSCRNSHHSSFSSTPLVWSVFSTRHAGPQCIHSTSTARRKKSSP